MLVSMRPEPDFWRGKRVLLTGHTGFKGAWLALWLQRLGAHVTGIALPPATDPSLFYVGPGGSRVSTAIFAMCATPRPWPTAFVLPSPRLRCIWPRRLWCAPVIAAPLETFATNVMGTAHLLDALRGLAGVRVAVVVTTDKVYRNREWAYPYREDDALGGHDPYSASKAATELVTASYRDAFLAAQGVAVATARAGNVIGGGDWAQDRLLPDAVRAWEAGQTLHIRRPQATRPWQHVLEPLAAYLCLAQSLWEQPALAGAYNFGPLPHEAATVKNVVKMASGAYPSSAASYENSSEGPHEAGWLALETAHARRALGIAPRWPLDTAVTRTMDWYRQQHAGADARDLCLADIAAWEAQA